MTLLRDARPADLEVVSALALRSKAHWGYDRAFIEACRAELTFTPERLTRERVRVAVDGGVVVGVSALLLERPDAELTALFVEPGAIGGGIGKKLFDEAADMARAHGARRLIIEADPNARVWYEARGARCVGEVLSGSIPGRTLPELALLLDQR